MSLLADWIESHAMPCTFKAVTGHECPWCGITRSTVHLLRGNWWESLTTFPALIPMLLLLFQLLVCLVFRKGWMAKSVQWNFIAAIAIMMVHFAWKHL